MGERSRGLSLQPGFKIRRHAVGMGDNIYGQLGDGTTTQRNIPLQIANANSWVTVAGGGSHSLGLKSDGTLWAWGNNNRTIGRWYQCTKNNPCTNRDNTKWVSISAGVLHSLGLKSDGTLWAWGYNNYGQLGDGSTFK